MQASSLQRLNTEVLFKWRRVLAFSAGFDKALDNGSFGHRLQRGPSCLKFAIRDLCPGALIEEFGFIDRLAMSGASPSKATNPG